MTFIFYLHPIFTHHTLYILTFHKNKTKSNNQKMIKGYLFCIWKVSSYEKCIVKRGCMRFRSNAKKFRNNFLHDTQQYPYVNYYHDFMTIKIKVFLLYSESCASTIFQFSFAVVFVEINLAFSKIGISIISHLECLSCLIILSVQYLLNK